MQRIVYAGGLSALALASAALLFQTGLMSQTTASLRGVVHDPAGQPIATATLEAKAQPSGIAAKALTDGQGQFQFASLTPGSYELRVTAPGFAAWTQRVDLKAGEKRQMQIALTRSAPTRPEVLSSATNGATGGVIGGVVGGVPGGVPGGMPSNAPPPAARDTKRAESRPFDSGRLYAPKQAAANEAPITLPHGIRRPSAPGNTEEYGAWVENEFAATLQEPLSTFSVDVDTASYSNARRFLMSGSMPPPSSVRVEEFVNYFRYNYPDPQPGQPVSVTTQVSPSPWNPGRQLLAVGLRTRRIPFEALPPSRLTFLIDVSGSMMEPTKLPLVQQSLSMLVRNLRPQDSVALVVYAGAAGVVLEPTPGNQQERIVEAIGRLSAGGSTHGSAGIRAAYDLARRSFVKGASNRVILATDGDFNVGVSSSGELIRLIEEQRQSGVFLTVLGFGMGNLKDSTMEQLADHGNGNYAYIDSLQEAHKVLVEQMGATLTTVAKDVKFQIEFNPSHVKAYRLVGYENRLLRAQDFNDDSKDSGDLGAGHQVTAFYELLPASSPETTPSVDPLRFQSKPRPRTGDELAWLKLRYKQPQSDHSQLLEWPVAPKSVTLEAGLPEFRFAAAVAEFASLLRQSKFAGQASYAHVLKLAGSTPIQDEHRSEFLDLTRAASNITSGISRKW